MGRIRVCFVVTQVRYEVGRFFFPVYFSASFKTQNIYLKKNCAVSKSTFEGFAPKDAARKTEFFCIRYFSKTKCKSTKTVARPRARMFPRFFGHFESAQK